MKVTREQIEAARNLAALTIELTRHDLPREVYQAFATLLAATAEPNKEELAAEARAVYQRPNLDEVPSTYWQWYTAGARREGRATTTEGGAS